MGATDDARARILVVDDAGEIVVVCVNMLQSLGFAVRTATSGLAALDLLAEEPFDLALIDFRMPGMNGFEVFTRARRVRPDLACVLLTGYGTSDIVDEAMAMGFSGVLPKPFNRQTLREAVETALAGRGSGPAPPPA